MSKIFAHALFSAKHSHVACAKDIVKLTPFVMIVWCVYWFGILNQACCQSTVYSAHASSLSVPGVEEEEHGHAHSHGVGGDAEAVSADQASCTDLPCADIVPSVSEFNLTLAQRWY